MKIPLAILIPARAGSKRVPNKNIVEVGHRPLIFYSIKEALKITPEVYVSTDCDKIAALSRTFGAKIIKRPANLATDKSDVRLTIMHFLKEINTDVLVLMQATSPFVKSEYVKEGLRKIKSCNSVISVCETREFFWTKARKPLNYNPSTKPRTQDMEPLYKENGAFYITKAENFIKNYNLVDDSIDFVTMPPQDSIDIDTKEDLKMLKIMLKLREQEIKSV